MSYVKQSDAAFVCRSENRSDYYYFGQMHSAVAQQMSRLLRAQLDRRLHE